MIRRTVGTVAAGLVVLAVSGCSSSTARTAPSATVAATTTTVAVSTTPAATTTTAPVISPAGDAARANVIDETVAEGTTAGVELDRDCVAKLVAQLSDDDAAKLAASTADTSPAATAPQLSTAGEQLGTKVLGCSKGSTNTTLIEAAATKVLDTGSGSRLDPTCVRTKLATLTDATLQLVIDSGPDATGDQLSTVGYLLLDCVLTAASS